MFKKLRLIPILALAVLFVGCDALFDDSETVWEGRLVEFRPVSEAITFPAGSEAVVEHGAQVQFIAAQEPNPNTITFEVDHEASTAVEGEHFQLIDEGSVTLPANSSATHINFQILGGGLDDGESVTLVLHLTDDGDVEPAERYRNYTLEIAKEEPEEEDDDNNDE